MAEKEKKTLGGLKTMAQKGLANIDADTIREKAEDAAVKLKAKAGDAKIGAVLDETTEIRNGLNRQYAEVAHLYGADYQSLNEDEKMLLGALVNNTKSLAAMFCVTVGE